MARKTQRLDVPYENLNDAAHRRQLAVRANAGLSKDGGNSMQVPLVLEFVKAADISGVIPPTSPYYPPLWQGGAVWVEDLSKIAYCTGTLWIALPGPSDYQPAGDYQPHDADLDQWATVTPSALGKSLVAAADAAAMRSLLGLWNTVMKTGVQSAPDSTLVSDTTLLFPTNASKTYSWRGVLHYVANAAQDFKIAFIGPAGATNVKYGHITGGGLSGVGVAPSGGGATAFSTAIAALSTGTDYEMFFAGTAQIGVTTGPITLQFASNTTGAASAVFAGSYLEWREL